MPPHLYPRYLIDHFVQAKQGWISQRLAEQLAPKPPLVRFCSETELKHLIEEYLAHYSSLMSLTPHSYRFKTTRSYWGSCSAKGVISFNLKLCFTNPSIVEYVVVHELSHLRWRGHGPRFWQLVKKYYPQTNEIRALLRQHLRA